MELIRIYCKSVNKEFQHNAIRIRHKIIHALSDMNSDNNIKRDELKNNYISILPVLGLNSVNEYYEVNSLLFLKTNYSKYFAFSSNKTVTVAKSHITLHIKVA